jgi:nitrite reductase/ring-hydroxylating ferredoxin subunit
VITIDLDTLGEGSTITAGSGPDGLRIVRMTGQEILIFSRVCDHEGASLDGASLKGGCLTCPWHAKRVKPLATVRLDAPSRQVLEIGPGYKIVIEDRRITVAGVS